MRIGFRAPDAPIILRRHAEATMEQFAEMRGGSEAEIVRDGGDALSGFQQAKTGQMEAVRAHVIAPAHADLLLEAAAEIRRR